MIFMLFIHHFYKKGGDDNNGDFQKDIRDTMPQINKQVFFIIIMLCGLLMVNKHVFDREKTVARITSSKKSISLCLATSPNMATITSVLEF